jgi:hypothetical protein
MKWDLTHRPRGADESTLATVEAPDSWATAEQLRGEIPDEHLVLDVRPER